jgi:DNA ligase 1
MKAFAALYRRLDETTKTSEKVAALADYFRDAEPASAAWAIYFLIGRKLKRAINMRELREACLEATGLSEWLFDESYDAVGDLGEVVAILLSDPVTSSDLPLDTWIEKRLSLLRGMSESERRRVLIDSWNELDRQERFVWNKLLTGSFRVGVSRGLVVRGLAAATGIQAPLIEHRLMGDWTPTLQFFLALISTESTETIASQPYPFCLAHALQNPPESLGDVNDWAAEWKWDGIRAQIVRRGGKTYIWSRGEELITEQFPDLLPDAADLPDGTVIDGEIVVLLHRRVQPFTTLQKRLNRRRPGKKVLSDSPVFFIAFDVLEDAGIDVRRRPLRERRPILERIVGRARSMSLDSSTSRFQIAESHTVHSWDELTQLRLASREYGVEGLMLKRWDSPYGVGRTTGMWWKWKIDPYSVDAVLIYAQRGHGRRASLYTDYTFGVWNEGQLVAFAKAYSGLTDAEIRKVDQFVRSHTLEKLGPVRVVEPKLVFELAFENLQLSNRHKSGLAVRFPRMARWRTDKTPEQADSLQTIRDLLPDGQAPPIPG